MRRTLVRSVILIITLKGYYYYNLSFNPSFENATPLELRSSDNPSKMLHKDLNVEVSDTTKVDSSHLPATLTRLQKNVFFTGLFPLRGTKVSLP